MQNWTVAQLGRLLITNTPRWSNANFEESWTVTIFRPQSILLRLRMFSGLPPLTCKTGETKRPRSGAPFWRPGPIPEIPLNSGQPPCYLAVESRRHWVKMIAHQAVAVRAKGFAFLQIGEGLEKCQVVDFPRKHPLAVVAAIAHAANKSVVNRSQTARHGDRLYDFPFPATTK